jgi:hypothetical protein
MRRYSKATSFVLGLFLLCLSTQLLSQTTTHGTITLMPGFTAFTWSTVTPPGQPSAGWTVTGSFDDNDNWSALCNPCFNALDPGGTIQGTEFNGGTANFTGILPSYYPSVDWGYLFADGNSYFAVRGPRIPLPQGGVGTFVGTFSFLAGLCGVTDFRSGQPEPCTVLLPSAFGTSMVGTGTVYITIAINQIGEQYATKVEYVF